jgi:hypothetical protein
MESEACLGKQPWPVHVGFGVVELVNNVRGVKGFSEID